MSAYRSLLLTPGPFRALFAGLALSQAGDGIAEIAITWSVWKATDSPLMVALALLLRTLPRAVLPFVAGVIADRQSPRLLMLVADLVRMILTLAVAGLGLTGQMGPGALMVTGFLLAVASSFFAPARAAVMPRIVPVDLLPAANGLMAGGFLTARLGGELLGGLLFPVMGAAWLILINGLTFGASLVAILLLPAELTGPAPARGYPGLLSEVRTGLTVVWQNPPLRWVVGTFPLGTFLLGGAVVVGKTMLVDQWGVGAVGLGLMSTGAAVGNAIGSLLAGRLRLRFPARLVMLGWMADGLLVVLMGISPSFALALAALTAAGVANGYINVPTESLIQASGAHVGKVYGTWSASIWAGESLSLVLLAPLYGLFAPAVVLGGVGLGAVGLGGLALRRCWSLPVPTEKIQPAVAEAPAG